MSIDGVSWSASVFHLVLGCFVASLFGMGKGPAKSGQGTAPLADLLS